jgi:hypothetical protein
VENITLASGAEFVVMKYVRSQPEAEALCAAEYDGGHLAWFMDTAEKDAVFAELGRMRSDLQWGNEMMWIGYTDEATEGTWVAPYPPAGYAADPNSDFGPIRPNAAQFGDFWETGEPNNNDGSGGDENCAALGVGDSVRAVDINCAQRREWGLCKIADAPNSIDNHRDYQACVASPSTCVSLYVPPHPRRRVLPHACRPGAAVLAPGTVAARVWTPRGGLRSRCSYAVVPAIVRRG